MNNDYINIIFDRKTLLDLSNILCDYCSFLETAYPKNNYAKLEVHRAKKIHLLIEERLRERKEK